MPDLDEVEPDADVEPEVEPEEPAPSQLKPVDRMANIRAEINAISAFILEDSAVRMGDEDANELERDITMFKLKLLQKMQKKNSD